MKSGLPRRIFHFKIHRQGVVYSLPCLHFFIMQNSIPDDNAAFLIQVEGNKAKPFRLVWLASLQGKDASPSVERFIFQRVVNEAKPFKTIADEHPGYTYYCETLNRLTFPVAHLAEMGIRPLVGDVHNILSVGGMTPTNYQIVAIEFINRLKVSRQEVIRVVFEKQS